MNRYVYVANNPVRSVDPLGLIVQNKTGQTICVKPEESPPYVVQVPPGACYNHPVDGVSYPNGRGGQDVYKVTNPYNDSDINVTGDGVDLPGPDCVNEAGGGGTKKTPPDDGWKPLFNCAGKHF